VAGDATAWSTSNLASCNNERHPDQGSFQFNNWPIWNGRLLALLDQRTIATLKPIIAAFAIDQWHEALRKCDQGRSSSSLSWKPVLRTKLRNKLENKLRKQTEGNEKTMPPISCLSEQAYMAGARQKSRHDETHRWFIETRHDARTSDGP